MSFKWNCSGGEPQILIRSGYFRKGQTPGGEVGLRRKVSAQRKEKKQPQVLFERRASPSILLQKEGKKTCSPEKGTGLGLSLGMAGTRDRCCSLC